MQGPQWASSHRFRQPYVACLLSTLVALRLVLLCHAPMPCLQGSLQPMAVHLPFWDTPHGMAMSDHDGERWQERWWAWCGGNLWQLYDEQQYSTFILRSASHNRQVCCVWDVDMNCVLDKTTSHHPLLLFWPLTHNCAAVATPQSTEGRLPVIRAHVRHEDTFSAE